MKPGEVKIFVLNAEKKDRLIVVTNSIIDLLEKYCKDQEEKAFCLKTLVESFEDLNECIIPLKGRIGNI